MGNKVFLYYRSYMYRKNERVLDISIQMIDRHANEVGRYGAGWAACCDLVDIFAVLRWP